MLAAWAAAVVVVKAASLDLHPKVQLAQTQADDGTKAAKPRRTADDAIILKRNLFGAPDVGEETDEGATPSKAADLKLRGIASSKGLSFAVFENTASGEQNVFGIGEKVFDGPKLVSVDPEGAEVLQRGKKKRFEIEEEEIAPSDVEGAKKGGHGAGKHGEKKSGKEAKGKLEKAGKDKSGKTKGGKDAGLMAGVRKTSESAYLVDRREVDNVVSNLNEVITQARAVPVMNEGKSAGFKLFAIRTGSIFQKLGLVDGDIVQRVNDTELTDPSKAVGLLEEIQSMDQIRVNFVRSGKLHTYTYTIR